MLEAIISALGAVIRRLKAGLLISRGCHWWVGEHRQRAGSPFYLFTLLPLKVGDHLYHYLVAL